MSPRASAERYGDGIERDVLGHECLYFRALELLRSTRVRPDGDASSQLRERSARAAAIRRAKHAACPDLRLQ